MSTLRKSNNRNDNKHTKETNDNNETRIRPSTKRPRAPIACFRCHHKKVRCDGAHPNCTRCLSTGVLCAYPSSRRSRTTQPSNVDPFIDNLSHLEARIRRIESDLENQRNMVQSIANSANTIENKTDEYKATAANDLNSKIVKTEMEVQDSRSILAQLRLRGEQRISRGKRAAGATAASSTLEPSTLVSPATTTETTSSSLLTKQEKLKNNNNSSSTRQSNMKSSNRTNNHAKFNKLQQQQNHPSICSTTSTAENTLYANCNYQTTTNIKDAPQPTSFYFQGMMLQNSNHSNSPSSAAYDYPPPGHGMDWAFFEQDAQSNFQKQHISLSYPPRQCSEVVQQQQHQQAMNNVFMSDSMFQDMSASPTTTRSSSLVSQLGGFPVVLQPSNSTNSTASNMTCLSSTTSCSSIHTCDNNIFNFSMDDIILHSSGNSHMESRQQDVHMLSANPNLWYYQSQV